ncbi:Rare lipoprotein A precursor [Hyphomicrobium sulfonivorans]|uniref:Endolytic peptidoglycan transglycosylase RlpA n=2 Tax=Hyphomicrobium sulfonivorans TaxID=121290 RepID=A0A109BDI4_HYPSL|nr:Rare lipoprotein A precursor [Hyphomicrobium sulfonivorans]
MRRLAGETAIGPRTVARHHPRHEAGPSAMDATGGRGRSTPLIVRNVLRLSVTACAAALAACSGSSGVSPVTTGSLGSAKVGTTESELGVAASPRLVNSGTVPKGGGVYKVGKPYQVAGRWYYPKEEPNYDRSGTASWYGAAFHGRKTSNGEIYDMHALTAGHPTLPMPSYAYVTNLQNNRTILVRINDRGPYAKDRMIDLSMRSAEALGFRQKGLAKVRVRYAGRAPLNGDDTRERQFLMAQAWSGGINIAQSATAGSITTASLGGPASSNSTSGRTAVATAATSVMAWTYREHRLRLKGSSRSALGAELPEPVYVRVGPFTSEAEAERLRRMLGGGDASQVDVMGADGAERFSVRMGPYDDPGAAAAMARIAEAGFAPQASANLEGTSDWAPLDK